MELFSNFILKAKETFNVKFPKFILDFNCKASYGSKALNSFQVLSPPTLRSSKANSNCAKDKLFLSVKLYLKFISSLKNVFNLIMPVSFVNKLTKLFKLKGPLIPVILVNK